MTNFTPQNLLTGLRWTAVLAGIVVVATLGLNVLANAYKPRLANAVSAATGMEITINGAVRLGLLTGLKLFLTDVHLKSNGYEFASADRVSLSLALLPMLQGNVELQEIDLSHPLVTLVHDTDGIVGLTRPELAIQSISELNLAAFSFNDATFRYSDQQSENVLEATGCQLKSQHLSRIGGIGNAWLSGISLSATLHCVQLSRNLLVLTDLHTQISVEDDYLSLGSVTMKIFGTKSSGSVQADFKEPIPLYSAQFSATRIQLDSMFQSLAMDAPAAGQVDVTLDLTAQGSTLLEFRQNSNGTSTLSGQDLTLFNTDLDERLDSFQSTQNFSLVDAGAFFFIGPFALLATKGYDLVGALDSSDGESKIVNLVTHWQLVQGVAEAKDVALATERHRIALTGKLDLVRNRFENINLILLDPSGCSLAQQEISGGFKDPEIRPPDIVRTLLGPLVNLIERGQELLLDNDCEVVYAGAVAATP